MNETAGGESQSLPATTAGAAFYSTGPLKFIVLSIGTLGLFHLYWFYRNWQAIRAHDASRIRPLWRAFFAPLWTFAFGNWLNDAARRHGIATLSLPTLPLGVLYLVLNRTLVRPFVRSAVFVAIFVLSVLVPLPFDFAVRRYNGAGPLAAPNHPRLAIWQVLGAICGAIYLVLLGFLTEVIAPDVDHLVEYSHHGARFSLPANWRLADVSRQDSSAVYDEIRVEAGHGLAVLRRYRKRQPPASAYLFTLEVLDDLAAAGFSVEPPPPVRQGAGDGITLESRTSIDGALRKGIQGHLSLGGAARSHRFRCYRIDTADGTTADLFYAGPGMDWDQDGPGYRVLLESLHIGPAPARGGNATHIDIAYGAHGITLPSLVSR